TGAHIESIYFSLCSLHLAILIPCVWYHNAQPFTVGALPLLPQHCSHDILTTDASTLSQTWILDLLDKTFRMIPFVLLLLLPFWSYGCFCG
ncbi:hypothetical protein EDC04DRAFT_2691092, partial [Pisolithus marmoratus]